jgi:hypothetical protein
LKSIETGVSEFKTFAQIVNFFAPFVMALHSLRLQNIIAYFSGKQAQTTVKRNNAMKKVVVAWVV